MMMMATVPKAYLTIKQFYQRLTPFRQLLNVCSALKEVVVQSAMLR